MTVTKIKAQLPDDLYIKIKTLKIKTHLNWSQLLSYLCDTIPRPGTIQFDYKLDMENTKLLEIRVQNDTWVKFNTFSIVFKLHAHAIDYLLKEENKKIGFSQLD